MRFMVRPPFIGAEVVRPGCVKAGLFELVSLPLCGL
jgi:hypothetical protein